MMQPAIGVIALWFLRAGTRSARAIAAVVSGTVAVSVGVLTGAPPATMCVLAAGVLAGAWGATVAIRRAWPGAPTLHCLIDGARLSAAAVAAAATSSLVAAGGAWVMRLESLQGMLPLISLRNLLGFLFAFMIAVPVLELGPSAALRAAGRRAVLETVVTAVPYAAIFAAASGLPITFVVLPVTLWVCTGGSVLRTGLHALTAAASTLAVTHLGLGPFSEEDAATDLLLAQWFLLTVTLLGLVCTLMEVQRQHAAARALLAENRLGDRVERALTAGVVVRVGDGTMLVVSANQAAVRLLGAPRIAAVVGRPLTDFLAGDSELTQRLPSVSMGDLETWHTQEVALRRLDGKPCWVDVDASPESGGPVPAVLLHLLDATERVHLRDRLDRQVSHDDLTGLANRDLFVRRLREWVHATRSTGARVTVLSIDLDHFKQINDAWGYAYGDQVLRAVAARLREAVGPAGTVARMGGDGFLVLSAVLRDPTEAVTLGRALRHAVSVPLTGPPGGAVRLSASVGVAVATPTTSADELLRRADAAVYAAKRNGRYRVELYSKEADAHGARELQLDGELRAGISAGQFVLHYQPVIDVRSGAVVGYEALVRWNHPTRGLLLPGEWMDVAEDRGAIIELGRWILAEACTHAAALAADGAAVHMNVNVSGRQLHDPGFENAVTWALAESGLPPTLLTLELTETHLVGIDHHIAGYVHDLRSRGVRISADDFGTGFSTLSTLVELDIDELKIDRTFVAGIGRDARSEAVIRGIIGLAEGLHARVVAEGVETEGQLAFLRETGCHRAQGWLWGRPQPAADRAARTQAPLPV